MNEQELREQIAKEIESNLMDHEKIQPGIGLCTYCLALKDAAAIARGLDANI